MTRLLREIAQDHTHFVLVDSELVADTLELLVEEEVKPEKKQDKHLKHLHHLEDLPVISGPEGFHHALQAMHKTHEHLSGKRVGDFGIQTKFDGSPSVVFGHHPATKKFFVATKAAFNKTPKLNFTDQDVEDHHGSSPILANKLKLLLKHLKGHVPKEGVFQGDMMYSAEDVGREGEHLNFTPNTITYHVKRDSDEGRRIMGSKAGIAVHTTYEMDKDGKMNAMYHIDMDKFNKDGDIHFLSTKPRGPHNYTGKEVKAYGEAIKKAREAHAQFEKMDGHIAIEDHRAPLIGYFNNAVKLNKPLSLAGYVNFLHTQLAKKTDKLKTEKGIMKLKDQLGKEIENVTANKKIYDKLFDVHKHLQDAKNVLVGALSKSSPYGETILGNKSKPEGFVVSSGGRPIKMVDRQHFSAANFEWNQQANPDDNPTVLSFGRMNPPTTGHGKLLAKGNDVARRIGGKHVAITSRKTGDKNNPLTPTQKIQWLKSMFPGQNIAVAGEDEKTLIAQIRHLYASNVRDLTIVAGSDRVKAYQNILAKYNGDGPNHMFNFKKIRVISSGERDPDSNDAEESMSASKMRKAAKENDFKTFDGGMPKHLKPKEREGMFHDLRAQMGVVKVDHMTNGHALSIYAKREDKIGSQARLEIERRKRHGIWSGS